MIYDTYLIPINIQILIDYINYRVVNRNRKLPPNYHVFKLDIY